jgi:hypothetical protein
MATAPSVPTLTAPANGAYIDFSETPAFAATFNSTDGADQNAFAFRLRTLPIGNTPGSAYQYWNGSTMVDTIQWVSVTTVPGGSFGSTVAPVMYAGYSYAWSFASQEASGSLQGAFATDFTMNCSVAPIVTVNTPTGTITTSLPAITWTDSLALYAVQTYYQVIVETGSFSTTPGSGTQIWNSGVVASSALTATMGSPVPGGASTRAFVQITQTGGQVSAWAYTSFTGPSGVPSAPTVSAATGTDGVTGCPLIAVTITGSSAGTAVVTRSDGLYVRGASPTNPATYGGSSLVVNDYEAVPTVAYTYSVQITASTKTSNAGTSGSVTLTTTNWWEFNPVAVATAINAQFIDWSPTQVEQSTGHPVMGQNVMNVVASTVLNQDFTGTAELFTAAVYTGFQALLSSGAIVFISSPWGPTDTGYFRIGIPSGGLSTGTGSTVKTTKLMPSTAAGPHRTVDVLAVAAPRPTV